MVRCLRWACLLVVLACGRGAEAELERARQHLAAGAYAEAAAAADRGLAAGPEGPVAWRLELAALEGEARSARTPDVLARLERLAGSPWAAQVTASLYVQTAGQLKEAGDAAGAVGVLDAGAKRFPGDAALAAAIERLQATGTSEEIERLRSLGYVE
jgi:hypothetical protein